MSLKVIDGTPTAISKYLREREMPDVYKRFEKCKCLTNEEKDNLIEFIRDKQKEEDAFPTADVGGGENV